MSSNTRSKTLSIGLRRWELVREDGETFLVGPEVLRVGRDHKCAIWLDDDTVSFAHAEVRATLNGLEVQDTDSLNGTFIDGVRVTKGFVQTFGKIRCGDSVLDVRPIGEKLQAEVGNDDPLPPLLGKSTPMRDLYRDLRKIAPKGTVSVLIQGETGVGKELVAEAIHKASGRTGQFVALDCTAIPDTLAEATLFGHVKGAFTGATSARLSPFEQADGGTIFLDEIGELPFHLQAKLLRVLQKKELRPVGGQDLPPRPFDARVIAATRVELEKAVNDGTFRSDLFFRIADYTVHVPPLRARLDDIELLVDHFARLNGEPNVLQRSTRASLEGLKRHDWPGNVRELERRVAVRLALHGDGPIDLADRLVARAGVSASAQGEPRSSDDELRPFPEAKLQAKFAFEQSYWARLHQRYGGNLSKMAVHAGVARSQVRAYVVRYGLREGDEDGSSEKSDHGR